MAANFKIFGETGSLADTSVIELVPAPPPRTTRVVRWATIYAQATTKREPAEFRLVDTALGQNLLIAHVEADEGDQASAPIMIVLNRTTQSLTIQSPDLTAGQVNFHVAYADLSD